MISDILIASPMDVQSLQTGSCAEEKQAGIQTKTDSTVTINISSIDQPRECDMSRIGISHVSLLALPHFVVSAVTRWATALQQVFPRRSEFMSRKH